jgi:hypothetical protein
MSRLKVGCIRVTHPCATLINRYCYPMNPVQLACIKPAASVHPEPGSNSPLLESFYNISSLIPSYSSGFVSQLLQSSQFHSVSLARLLLLLHYLQRTLFSFIFYYLVSLFPCFVFGSAKVQIFSLCASFFESFFQFFFPSASLFFFPLTTLVRSDLRLPVQGCKDMNFSCTSKLILIFFLLTLTPSPSLP